MLFVTLANKNNTSVCKYKYLHNLIFAFMTKRFEKKFKRSKSHLANLLLLKVIGKQFKGKNFTIYMIQNWMYGRTPNEILEKEFELLMQEVEPESLTDAFEMDELEVA